MSFGFIDFAKDVLKASDSPLSVEEMWEAGCNLGLDEKLGSSGKTPIRTLSARIYVDIKDNTDSVFIQVSKRPAKFFLKGKDIKSEKDIPESDGKRKSKFLERDLHILLSSFVCTDEHFKCMTKTIYHEVSKREKSGKNKWLHPDIVGVHFPFDSYTDNTLKLFDVLKVNPYKLYSFEMKISLTLSNLREYYFQAVSNSSWAHEGYLVALKISEEPELMDELRRLNNAFGIGVIRLDAEHFMQSEILFSAKEKDTLDWDTINRLVDDNRNFKSFLNDLMEDVKVGKVKSRYDDVYLEEEQMYQYVLKCGILLKSGDGFQQSFYELKKQFPTCNESEIISIIHLACKLYSYRSFEKSELVVTAPNSFNLRTRKTKTVVEELIKNAEKSITLTGYSISDYFSEMIDILAKKGTQGMYINLYINDLDKHRETLEKLLLYSGRFIKIYNYNKQNDDKMAALHAKIIVVDDKKVFISSANLSYHGMNGNIEMGILLESVEKSKKIQETLKILRSQKIFVKYT